MSFKYFLKNGNILPIKEAVIPISNIEYSYGFGVYESIRVSKGVIYFIDEHIDRLLKSAKIIGLYHVYSKKDIKEYVDKLVNKIEIQTFNIKILLIGAQQKEKALLFIIPSNPLFPDKKVYRDGVCVLTANYERAFPDVKSLNMMRSYIEYKRAKDAGCYDALLVNNSGHVTEGTRTNFFAVKGNIVYTPQSKHVLRGVTRTMVLRVASLNSIEIIEKDILKDELNSYDGVFLTSTSSKIVPIKKIDNIEYNIPQITKDLIKLFNDFLSHFRAV